MKQIHRFTEESGSNISLHGVYSLVAWIKGNGLAIDYPLSKLMKTDYEKSSSVWLHSKKHTQVEPLKNHKKPWQKLWNDKMCNTPLDLLINTWTTKSILTFRANTPHDVPSLWCACGRVLHVHLDMLWPLFCMNALKEINIYKQNDYYRLTFHKHY